MMVNGICVVVSIKLQIIGQETLFSHKT